MAELAHGSTYLLDRHKRILMDIYGDPLAADTYLKILPRELIEHIGNLFENRVRFLAINSCGMSGYENTPITTTYDLLKKELKRLTYFPAKEKESIYQKYVGMSDGKEIKDWETGIVQKFTQETEDYGRFKTQREVFMKKLEETIQNTETGHIIYCGSDLTINDCCYVYIYVGSIGEILTLSDKDINCLWKLREILSDSDDIAIYKIESKS